MLDFQLLALGANSCLYGNQLFGMVPIIVLLHVPIVLTFTLITNFWSKMPRKRYTFLEDNIQNAKNAVLNLNFFKKSAAKIFNIPWSTLQFRLNKNFKKSRPSPITVLTKNEENKIVEWVVESCKRVITFNFNLMIN